MIGNITMKNFGPLTDFAWNDLGKINVILGGNSTGKTFLLKALYTSMRTINEYKNSFSLGWALCLERHPQAESELPDTFKTLDLAQTHAIFF